MSEQIDRGTEAIGDPAAVSLALTGASRPEADAYLRDHRHHLHEQLNQIHLDVWEKKLGVLLRLATLCVGFAVAAGFGYLVWDAAHSKGLIIEPFSVPADLTQRGLSGEVIAGQMIDKLTAMTKSESSRAVQSYANNWGNNIKVEIPETGVSIGELRSFLREWLGHDIHMSGEIYRTATGIAVTSRASGEEGATFIGPESDLDALVQKAAEHVYEVTQPYRYANYLDRNYDPKGVAQRVAKATQIYRRLIAGDDPKEQAWAWNGLATIQFNFYADNRKSVWYYQKALATDPDFTLGYYAIAARQLALGDEENQFRNISEFARRAEQGTPELNPRYARSAVTQTKGVVLTAVGDFAAAIPILVAGGERTDNFSVLGRTNFTAVALSDMVRMHDLKAARAYIKTVGGPGPGAGGMAVSFWLAMETGDWSDMLAREALAKALYPVAFAQLARTSVITADFSPPVWAYVALARARSGDIASAEKLVARAPDDTSMAGRVRALIAEQKGDHTSADAWFDKSEAQTPSIPLTDLWWGQVLLARGSPDKAIEKFTLANQKGPHFADPLEGWGEALMAKNQSRSALEKFSEAEKYAPNWGRLHLKWGEALYFAGKKDEAAKQFARAAALDLTPSEKSELAGMAEDARTRNEQRGIP
jgi:tetratricopeptide (TPR) repeat protein